MKAGGSSKGDTSHALRASVSFPSDLYRTLEEIAKQKKVSIAWVVREAAERYAADELPLFRRLGGGLGSK